MPRFSTARLRLDLEVLAAALELQLGEHEQDLAHRPAHAGIIVSSESSTETSTPPAGLPGRAEGTVEGAALGASEAVELGDGDPGRLAPLGAFEGGQQAGPVVADSGLIEVLVPADDLVAKRLGVAGDLLALHVGGDERVAFASVDAGDPDVAVEVHGRPS